MAYQSTPPKFTKRSHHVVPQGWQRRFFPIGAGGTRATGGYYKDVQSGTCLGPVGPGDKMAEEYANILFDAYYRPSDALEDRLAEYENKAIPGLDRVVSSKAIGPDERRDISYLLGLQACRYPDLYKTRLDLAKYLALALGYADTVSSSTAFNKQLQESGMLPGVALTDAEFNMLVSTNGEKRSRPSTRS